MEFLWVINVEAHNAQCRKASTTITINKISIYADGGRNESLHYR